MNQGTSEVSDQVTILVFKDNYSSRNFQISLKWISKLGILLLIIVFIAILSSFLAIRYYRISARNHPSHIRELEQELTDLRTSLKNLENKNTENNTSCTSAKEKQHQAIQTPPFDIATQTSTQKTQNTQNPTDPTPLSPSQPSSSSEGLKSVPVFSSFPATSKLQIPDEGIVPISIQAFNATWKNKTLKVHFQLQYTRSDRGNQEGKIIIIARGADHLLSYPKGTLNLAEKPNLYSLENGEFFSVSRFREVNANFGPLPSQEALQEIEVFLFDLEGHILIYQRSSL